MKKYILLIFMLIITKQGYMSGMAMEKTLEEVIHSGSLVVSVEIIDASTALIPQIKKAERNRSDSNSGRFGFYKAIVKEIISGSFNESYSPERWTIEYSESDKKTIVKNREPFSIQPGDTIALFNVEDIAYSYIYHVEKKRKIVYYERCPEIVKEVKNGKKYLFISNGSYSKKNRAAYGAIQSGLIEDTAENRGRIAAKCKGNSL